MSKSASKSASESASNVGVPSPAASADPPPLSLSSLTDVLEGLARPALPPLPAELAALVSDYWQAQPTLQMLSDGKSQLVRSAPKIARVLQDFQSSRSLKAIWAAHPGVFVAGALIAVWTSTVCAPRLKSATELDEWIEVLLPVSRYLEPALSDEPRRDWEEATRQLSNAQWVAGWISDPDQAQRIVAHAASAGAIRNRPDYDRKRQRGVEHLLTGIQTVLGQGPLPPGSITKLLPGVEPAPSAGSLHAPGTVTLPSGVGSRPLAAPLLPLDYVARAELAQLIGQLTPVAPETACPRHGFVRHHRRGQDDAGGRRWRMARRSQASFPNGILWATC